MKPKYKRVLVKISGEALAGEAGRGFDFGVIENICLAIRDCVSMGVQIAVVVGGGNLWRGAKDGQGCVERTRADSMGMLATAMNALAVTGTLEKAGVKAKAMTAVSVGPAADLYARDKAVALLEDGYTVILGCGTGNPFFSTDTAAVLRGAELDADMVLMAKNIDAVYTADPRKDSEARKLESISCSEILQRELGVIDLTAAALAKSVGIPIMLFGIDDPKNICRAAEGQNTGTVITDR